MKNGAVAATGAQNRRTARERCVDLFRLGLGNIAEELVAQILQTVSVELKHIEFGFVLHHLNAHRADLIFKERIELLDD
ncbi:MAG: hypothetical protein J6R66_01850, partial [Clostridia bacterium]|nr:hypothetical protein [Clostridia bacterium]